jgi:hypothetical protein
MHQVIGSALAKTKKIVEKEILNWKHINIVRVSHNINTKLRN